MRIRRIRRGLTLLSCGILIVTGATFFHGEAAYLLFLSPGQEARFVYAGLLWGALLSCLGVLVTAAGLMGGTVPEDGEIRLRRSILAVWIAFMIFLGLFFFKGERGPTGPAGSAPITI